MLVLQSAAAARSARCRVPIAFDGSRIQHLANAMTAYRHGMNQQIVHAAGASFSWRAVMPWLVGVGIYALLALLAGRLLNDPDSYWHIAVGRWIVEHGAVPHADPFSHTMPGAHWIAFEWLSEVLYATAFGVAGWSA